VSNIRKNNNTGDFLRNLILANQDIDISWINLEPIWDGMLKKDIKDRIGINFPKSVCEMKKGRTINLYVESDDLKNFINISARTVLTNDKLLGLYKTKTIKITKKIRDYATELFDQVDNLSLDQILEILPKIKKLQSESMVYGCVVAFADVFGEITNKTTEILNNRKNLKYPTNVYSFAISGLQKTLTQQAYEDIVSSKLSDEKLLHKYFWLDQGYIGRGLTMKRLQEIKDHRIDTDNKKYKEELLKELKLNIKEKKIFKIFQSLVLIKSLRADSRQFLNVVVSRMMDKIATELNLDIRFIETLYTEELCALLKGNNKILNTLTERYNHSLFIAKGPSDYSILLGDQVDFFLKDRLFKQMIEKTDEIKGQVAYPGKVKGIVKIVFGPQHIVKIEEGDILVSTATSPQVLPAMKKAIAFVTDVGGITSHAAIVSRELKKPCVVGTKIATQLLKDGDEVEVDADNGVVKIIKKNS
jgi:phosphohistidine swiveling domain-containing protein